MAKLGQLLPVAAEAVRVMQKGNAGKQETGQEVSRATWIESSKSHAKSCSLGDATVPVCSSVKLFRAQVGEFLLGRCGQLRVDGE